MFVKPVFLDERARELIEREAVARRLRETGGAVFGWEGDEGLVVACATGPGPNAKHRPRSFQPAPGTTRAAIDAVREASDGRYGFLGSWHTHPLATPVPSKIDIGTAEAMAAQVDLLLPAPLILIVSTTGTKLRVVPQTMRAWRWIPEEGCLRAAEINHCLLPERYCPPAALLFADELVPEALP